MLKIIREYANNNYNLNKKIPSIKNKNLLSFQNR